MPVQAQLQACRRELALFGLSPSIHRHRACHRGIDIYKALSEANVLYGGAWRTRESRQDGAGVTAVAGCFRSQPCPCPEWAFRHYGVCRSGHLRPLHPGTVRMVGMSFRPQGQLKQASGPASAHPHAWQQVDADRSHTLSSLTPLFLTPVRGEPGARPAALSRVMLPSHPASGASHPGPVRSTLHRVSCQSNHASERRGAAGGPVADALGWPPTFEPRVRPSGAPHGRAHHAPAAGGGAAG